HLGAGRRRRHRIRDIGPTDRQRDADDDSEEQAHVTMSPRGGPDPSALGRERGAIVVRRVAEYERKLHQRGRFRNRISRGASLLAEARLAHLAAIFAFAASMTAMTALTMLPVQSK